ncbi:MAG TPA: 8-amino-7-oxononanoate synthase [Gammaproteobacteria bacterium]|nr:8-amino-7-oxononanoate synthase [Gammaproteobacteria bacterium]
MKSLAAALARQRQARRYRSRLTLESPQGPEIRLDGQRWLNFCSNDYLGLAADPRVIAALRQGAERYGAGSGASHLICGHLAPHRRLEEALADFTGRARALLFSTGYMANLGTICALVGRGDRILADRLCHASLLDGARLSGARLRRFPHLQVDVLARHLAQSGEGRVLVITEGVFSMDGDLSPLPALAQAARTAGAWLMVDDAHGLGVLGRHGGGSLEHHGLTSEDVPILMGTLGKALGTAGAFVAGDDELIEYLIQFARPYIYTTALPPAVAHAACAALAIASSEPWRREHLQALCRRFLAGARQLGLGLPGTIATRGDSQALAPIFPLLVGDNDRALAMSRALAERGILVTAIRPPTVPANTARLRITLSAAHDESQVDRLLETLAALS